MKVLMMDAIVITLAQEATPMIVIIAKTMITSQLLITAKAKITMSNIMINLDSVLLISKLRS